MSTKPKTKIQIIRETAAYYNSSNRASNRTNTNCKYYICKNGEVRECAVGRCLIDSKSFKNRSYGATLTWYNDNELNMDLKPEYQGHTVTFWSDLQEFHDGSSYWNKEGLSPAGKERLNELINDYKKVSRPKKSLTGDV